MNTPPALPEELLEEALARHWRFPPVALDYLAVGFGSHHWVVTAAGGERRFLTVDLLTKDRFSGEPAASLQSLDRAFRSALALYEGGLEFVVAPLRTEVGGVVVPVGDRFAAALYPFVEGRTDPYGEFASDADRQAMLELAERVHAAGGLARGIAARDDLELPARAKLEAALAALQHPWTGGPYSERARLALAEKADEVHAALELYDRLALRVRSARTPWVLTHGEMHSANVIWSDGGPRLIDWDTALFAPPARDLWMLVPYLAGEDPALSLYRLWWDLAEVGIYVAILCGPHEESADLAEMWRNLRFFLGLRAYRLLSPG